MQNMNEPRPYAVCWVLGGCRDTLTGWKARVNPLDWEAVESRPVAPVQVLFKDEGSYPPESGGVALAFGKE